jgi:hypothetical protein
MHYIFDRRLTMLDIALHDLKEEDLSRQHIAEELWKDHRIEIPELEWSKEKISFKKEKLNDDNAPEDFHIVEGKEYEYLEYSVPFSGSEFIDDIFKTADKTEGISIHKDKVIYREYSHDKIEDNQAETDRIRFNAKKALGIVAERLDEFAADAAEFNQTVLPSAIASKLANEKGMRVENSIHK